MDIYDYFMEKFKRDPSKVEKYTLKQILEKLIIEHLQSMFKWTLPDP